MATTHTALRLFLQLIKRSVTRSRKLWKRLQKLWKRLQKLWKRLLKLWQRLKMAPYRLNRLKKRMARSEGIAKLLVERSQSSYISRGIEYKDIKSRLEEFCAESGCKGNSLYLLFADGRGLPVASFLRELLNQEERHDMVRSMRVGRPRLLRLSVPNARIHLGNNVRVTFPVFSGFSPHEEQRTRTAKVAVPSRSRKGNLIREIRARKFLAETLPNNFIVPTVSRYSPGQVTWFEEEYVNWEDGFTNAERAEFFLSKCALQFYRSTSRPRPVMSSLRWFGVSLKSLQAVFDQAGVHPPDSLQIRTWPVALIHGDLSPVNMIASRDGRLWVGDWEGFCRGPVAWELRTMFEYDHQKVFAILQTLRSPGDLSPECQMLILLALRLIRLRRLIEVSEKYYTKTSWVSSIQYSKFIGREKELLLRINSLAACSMSV
jgi:thiamine kinase-like enzyme